MKKSFSDGGSIHSRHNGDGDDGCGVVTDGGDGCGLVTDGDDGCGEVTDGGDGCVVVK